MNLIPSDLFNYLPMLQSGLYTTLALMVSALLIAGFLSTAFSYQLFAGCSAVKGIINIYLAFIRGTPLLVQIYLIYYGNIPLIESPFMAATLALALNSAAYTTVLLSGAIARVPKGEIEACRALGLTERQLWWGILLSRATRRLIPAYSNEVIIILKSTALASTITLMDLMGVIREISSITYETLPWLMVAGIMYSTLTLILVFGLKSLKNT